MKLVSTVSTELIILNLAPESPNTVTVWNGILPLRPPVAAGLGRLPDEGAGILLSHCGAGLRCVIAPD